MDIQYYNSQIKEELDGAKAYICRAINCKDRHPDWSKRYAEMSEMELGHAKTLLSIFNEDFKMEVESGSHSEDYNELAKSLKDLMIDMCAEGVDAVEKLHTKYESI